MIRTTIRSLSQASRSVASSSSSSIPTSARSIQRFNPSSLPKDGSSWSAGSFRGYASGPPPANTGRTLLILSAAAAGVGYIVYAKNGDGLNVSVLGAPLGMGTKPISESVLDQKTLKSSGLHSTDSPAQSTSSPNLPHNRPQSAPTSAPASVEAKATEASDSTQGAFNEETGEINWDCPCLGGMADGPCGEDFKAAFSCFVFSEAEPKGMDCVEKFKAMQDCFREHPDIYGEEIAEDEEQPAAIESSGETPEHPIPGNEPGDVKTPAQKEKGISLPKDQMPEHSFIKDVNPENSVKKGPVSSRG